MLVLVPLLVYILLDNPFAILEKCLESVCHVQDSMLGSHPANPQLTFEPEEGSNEPVRLALRESGYLEHHRVDIASKSHVEQELAEVLPSVSHPLVCDLSDRLARVHMLVFIVVPVCVAWFLVLRPPIVPRLLIEPIEPQFSSRLLSCLTRWCLLRRGCLIFFLCFCYYIAWL